MSKFVRDSESGKQFASRLHELKQDWSFALDRAVLEITESISRQMNRRNLSRAQLAEILGTSRSYVTQLVKGKPNLQLNTLFKVAFAIGLRPAITFESLEIETLPKFEQVTRGVMMTPLLRSSVIQIKSLFRVEEYETEA
jgi:transcriptional regulator with XRE-family HTH domain